MYCFTSETARQAAEGPRRTRNLVPLAQDVWMCYTRLPISRNESQVGHMCTLLCCYMMHTAVSDSSRRGARGPQVVGGGAVGEGGGGRGGVTSDVLGVGKATLRLLLCSVPLQVQHRWAHYFEFKGMLLHYLHTLLVETPVGPQRHTTYWDPTGDLSNNM